MPAASGAKPKPKPKPKAKTVKARNIITVDEDSENGRLPMGLLARAARVAQKRRPKKPLTDLFTKIAEKSTVDVSQVKGICICMGSPQEYTSRMPVLNKSLPQVRKVYEATESVLTTDLKEHGVFKLPGIVTFSRKQLPARPDMGEKMVCGRLVKVPARGAIYKVKIAVSGQLKAALT